METKPKVTISLLTWNGAEYLPWLFKSLKQQSFFDWDLLVLDNASADNSVDVVLENYPKARIIKQKENLGFARGHNLVVKWSHSDYIFILNQDIILDVDYLAKTVKFLDENPSVASVSGKLMYWDFIKGEKTNTIDSFGFKVDRQRNVVDAHQGKKDFDISNREVFGLSAAAMLVRREALESIKIPTGDNDFEYFDEDFFAYKEDVDLAWRLRLRSWENWLIKDTKAYHHRTVSSNKSLRERRKNRKFANRLSYRNHIYTIYKNSFSRNIWRDIWFIFLYEFKKFIYLLLFERSTLASLGECIGKWPRMHRKRKIIKKNRQVKADDIYYWFK